MRDEYRTEFDAGRGGYGAIYKEEMSKRSAALAEMGAGLDMAGGTGGGSYGGSREAKRFRRGDDSDDER